MHGGNGVHVFHAGNREAALIDRQGDRPTSLGLGSRPSAFHRKPRLRAVLAAESTVFLGLSAHEIELFRVGHPRRYGRRLAQSLAAPSTALAHSG